MLEPGKPDARDLKQLAYQIKVWDSIADVEKRDAIWDSGKIQSPAQFGIEYAGPALRSGRPYAWRVRVWDQAGSQSDWSAIATWTMGLLGPHWSRKSPSEPGDAPPKWIGAPIDLPWSEHESGPAILLRKKIDIAGEIDRAIVYVSSLGLYELQIDGANVQGEEVLSPGWTDYHKRVHYQTYDVTEPLHRSRGEHAISVTLAPGWYAGRIGLTHLSNGGARRGIYGRHLRLYLELHVFTRDGKTHVIRSDESWKYSTDGPVVATDLLDGETFDARRDDVRWRRADFDDASWKPVACNDNGPLLQAMPCEPIRVTQSIPAIAVTEPKSSVYIFDLGQNIAGRCRVTIRGRRSPGDEIVLQHVEVLNADGTIYRDNLRIPPISPLGAPQEDRYICGTSDKDTETFEPHFTFHGFRYVQVTGLKERPQPADLVGRVMHTDAPIAGELECSSDLLNRIMRAIVWTQRDNMISVPTDCPQRDERLGWTGDMQVFCGTASFNMDVSKFLAKWMQDLVDAQCTDGHMPDFAPHPFDPDTRFSRNPGWGDAAPIGAWKLYTMYGDRRLLEEMYEPCARMLRAVHRDSPDLIWRGRAYPFMYGDWLTADTLQLEGWPRSGGEVPKDIYSTAFFAHHADLMTRMATVLGRESDAREFSALAMAVKKKFVEAFVDSDAKIKGDTQAGYALALAFDLLPERMQERAAAHMVEALKPYGGALSTGFQSTLRMMLQLSRFGYHDQAYALVNRREMPSWGYMVEHGGTTIWERWDGFVEGRGYQNPGMNSFCHYAIGAVGEWMYRVIGGINPDESQPGFGHVIIKPIPGGGLTWAKCAYPSVRGRIVSDWKVDGAKLTMNVVIPPNMTATVHVPESGKKEIGSGTYEFESTLTRKGS
ncbi:MAG: family 78 glycoside hydrolase catalytic domain [Anaerolineae bacterium]|nr:family 78 glycoside hydrolase catalytic domain [Phycisphaerae bacterium]